MSSGFKCLRTWPYGIGAFALELKVMRLSGLVYSGSTKLVNKLCGSRLVTRQGWACVGGVGEVVFRIRIGD